MSRLPTMSEEHCDMSTVCLAELFERQVDQTPQAPALVFQERSWTYQELDRQANRWAHILRDFGVGPGTLVGIHFYRSDMPVIAILAVLKAGGGYVPLDPCFPAERCRFIKKEAKINVLLTQEGLMTSAGQFFQGQVLAMDKGQDGWATCPSTRLSRRETGLQPCDLSYVLYTSGTTGRPKGVMTEHRHVVRFIHAFSGVCRLSPADRFYHGFAYGFDGSVEEIWMAFAHGASLYVAPDEVVKVGSEAARFINQHKLTFFSTVPTFLSMIQSDLASVRLLIVSGEICSQPLVDRWAHQGRRMLNVYGPTETTVNATSAECRAGRPVTIGRPLPGYELRVLDDNQHPVPVRQWGELYIGGGTLARGYLNQPDLTSRQFIASPRGGRGDATRLYRTGDRVRWNGHGELEFQGRIDSQVKLRGFRIELAEIESVLRELPLIAQAVAHVTTWQGLPHLAAYVVLSNGEPLDRAEVLRYLQCRLPVYMIPATLDVIETIPTLDSGKADRKQLPEPKASLVSENREIVAPQNQTEYELLVIWQEILGIECISNQDDFFMDLGGHSLLAAQMVSQVRQKLEKAIALRDVYRFPTIAQLAAHFSFLTSNPAETESSLEPEPGPTSREVYQALPRWERWVSKGLQTLSLYGLYGWTTVPFALLMLTWISVYREALPLQWGIGVSIVLTLGYLPLEILLVVAIKWIVVGRYQVGRYPVGGFFYWRWWLVNRLQAMSGVGALAGTPLMPWFYRLMGAKVGRHCHIDTAHCCCFDLITLGHESSINAQTQLLGYRVENGELVLGTVTLGERCFVGIHSALGLNTRMENDSCLDDLSLLNDNEVVPAGEGRQGSPSQPGAVRVPEIKRSANLSPRSVLFGLLHLVSLEILGCLLLLSLLPSILAAYGAWVWQGLGASIVASLLVIPFDIVLYCLWVALLKRLILHRTPPGCHSVYSLFYLRKWLADSLVSISRVTMHALYTTIYLPPWLRLLGARIGRRAEISTVSQITPDLVDIADESFFADGSMVGGRHLYRGHVHCDINRIGRRSFVGNNAILPLGQHLGDECLLGVLSTPPQQPLMTPEGSDWLGSPAFQLPHRQKVEGFDESVTYRPTVKLYIQRLLIDGLRILMPAWLAGGGTIALLLFLWYTHHLLSWPMILALTPAVSLVITVAITGAVIGLKWLIMGRMKPVIKPLWSTYVWWNEAINGLHETIAVPVLSPLVGTPYLAWYLRGLGCKIGKHCFLATTLFSEFDLVHIGDYASLNEGMVAQNHLFEDRIMKSSHIHIADNCNVGNMAIVLYDTHLAERVTISPLSLLMKGESLAQNTYWQGIPTRPR